MTIIGMTGSGKTTLANSLIQVAVASSYPIAILDIKGDEVFDQYNPITRLDKIRYDDDVIVYRPNEDEVENEDILDTFLLRMYKRERDGIIYIDELMGLGEGMRTRKGLRSNITRGRTHLVGKHMVHTTLISATQSPRRIPTVVLRQSTSFAVFTLIDDLERKRVREFTHPDMMLLPESEHGFRFYTRSKGVHMRPIPLQLKVA